MFGRKKSSSSKKEGRLAEEPSLSNLTPKSSKRKPKKSSSSSSSDKKSSSATPPRNNNKNNALSLIDDGDEDEGDDEYDTMGQLPLSSSTSANRRQKGSSNNNSANKPLYPSLDSVRGHSVRIFYPEVTDVSDEFQHPAAASLLNQNHNNKNEGAGAGLGRKGSSEQQQQTPQQFPSSLSSYPPRTNSGGSTDSSSFRNNNNTVGTATSTSPTRPPSSSSSAPLMARGGSSSSSGSQQQQPRRPQSSHASSSTAAAAATVSAEFSFGRPSNRSASLEDDVPGGAHQQQRAHDARTASSSSAQEEWGNMTAAVAAATSSSSLVSTNTNNTPVSNSNNNTSSSNSNTKRPGAISASHPPSNHKHGVSSGGFSSSSNSSGGGGTKPTKKSSSSSRNMQASEPTTIATTSGPRQSFANPAYASPRSSRKQQRRSGGGLLDDDEDDQDESDGNESDDSDLRRALLESSKESQPQHQQPNGGTGGGGGDRASNGSASGTGGDGDASENKLSPQRLEAIQSNLDTLRNVCNQKESVEAEVLQFCLQQCDEDQKALKDMIEQVAMATDEASLQELTALFELNEKVLAMLERGKQVQEEKNQQPKPQRQLSSHHHDNNSNNHGRTQPTTSLQQQHSQQQSPPPSSFASPTESGGGSSGRVGGRRSLMEDDEDETTGGAPTKTNLTVASSMEIGTLVEKQDIFSLICMLRSQTSDERLDAALALMKFARRNDPLREEIHSSGGLHSLLTLFLRSAQHATKLTSALAVAYVLPAAVVASAGTSTFSKPQVGLKIMECLQFLSTNGGSSDATTTEAQQQQHTTTRVKDERIPFRECLRVAAMGLTTFWIHVLEPQLRSSPSSSSDPAAVDKKNNADMDDVVVKPPPVLTKRTSSAMGAGGRQRNRAWAGTGGGTIIQRGRGELAAGVQELLEMAVTLVIRFASYCCDTATTSADTDAASIIADTVLLVEQVCAMEAARPIAVREGILRVLVEWIRSPANGSGGGGHHHHHHKDSGRGDESKMRPAAVLAVRHLTSIKDRYMAGWIHSQMVSSGALPAIVALTRDMHQSYPVRLAIVEVLSSLCIAPHTRAAVVEADDCIAHFLIDLLYEYNNNAAKELVLHAGQALLQLAAGAMQRAGGGLDSTHDDKELLLGFITSRERHDRILNDIVARGAIASFVAIALEKRGKLRMIAIETLGVLSEDVSPSRGTRLQLCEDGAARALGETLLDCLTRMGRDLSTNIQRCADEDLEQLYQALCALSNILDPTYEGVLSRSASNPETAEIQRPKSLLTASCLQAIESGGLKSMLQLATFPLVETRVVQLVEETCHALSLLSPFLLSKEIAYKGLAGWADQVLDVFCNIVKSLGAKNSEADDFGENMDMHVSLLQGIGALAKSAPLKVRIVDRVLPYLIRAKNSRDHTHVSNSASQAFQSLEFADDDMAVQTAGNNANLLADWFCLQRSFLIQAMARSEIRQHLVEMWGEAFAQSNDPAATKLARGVSSGSRSSTGSSMGSDLMAQIGGEELLEKDLRSVIREYEDMFGEVAVRSLGRLSPALSGAIADDCGSKGLLSPQVYPLDSSRSETAWILNHAELVKEESRRSGRQSLSEHVERLLEPCFPSSLLRERVIPTQMINLESSYNFRAILMPQRRYFSFRREGLLLSRLLDKESSVSDSAEVHWTLNFTNSSFAGEFPESLVQALYMCPTICALSFVGITRKVEQSEVGADKTPSITERSLSMSTKAAEGGGLIANLVGSLPPWVANLTFERVLDDQDMKALIAILETIGRLTAGQGLTQSLSPKAGLGARSSAATNVQAQGRFSFFAVRYSPELSSVAWRSFFSLIGDATPSRIKERRPLSTLRSLDISGNGLSDELCATLLEIVHDKESGCHIEDLDLSGNRIVEGKHVLRVLTWYCQTHRSHKLSGVKVRGTQWQAPLRTLRIASNGLSRGKAWLEIIALLKHNTLELKVLDLSSNKLALKEDDYDSDILVSSLLKNTYLQCLNLSGNHFSSGTINEILGQLYNVSGEKGLALIDLTKNNPPLNQHQERQLGEISRSSRNFLLQRLNAEKEAKNAETLDASYKLDFEMPETSRIDENAPMEQEPSPERRELPSTPSSSGVALPSADNKITVLFSAPLVFKDNSGNLRPFAKLDFEMERELLWQCLKEASRDIELSFDSATHDRLLATVSKRCSCLHYSGHGNERYLPFEDGKGGPNWFEVEDIKQLIGAREGDVPFRFVFVSACYSGLAGETFAAAGVPHVVCCRQEFELKDAAALAFTRQFYLALAVGHTVKESFELGCKAVRATPNLRDAELEMEKFILLPKDGNHDVPIFDAKPVMQWPQSLPDTGALPARGVRSKSMRVVNKARSGELSVRNMIQDDPSPSPPQFFLGREVDLYMVLNLVLVKRLVSVVGDVGVGRSSLVCALCHYINERKTTMNQIKHIYYIKAKQGRAKQNRMKSLVQRLVKKLIESDIVNAVDVDKNSDIETLSDIICKSLKNEQVLIVFDRTELLEDADEANEFPLLLSNLFRETRNVRVLLTAKESLGIPSIGGQVDHFYRLGPLTYANSVRLFSSLCPYMHTPSDRRRLYNKMVENMEVAELLPTDPGISLTIRTKFGLIGNGVPSNIEKAAYTISKEDFMSLLRTDDGGH